MKRQVTVSEAAVKKAIVRGDAYGGRYYLVVSPEGETKVMWADHNRFWNPWGSEDQVLEIPALNPEGSGKEIEDAFQMLSTLGIEYDEDWDESPVELIKRLASQEWEDDRCETVNFLFDEFIEEIKAEFEAEVVIEE